MRVGGKAMRKLACSNLNNFFTSIPNCRNEIIQLNFTANVKFDSKVDSSLTAHCQISWDNSCFFNFATTYQRDVGCCNCNGYKKEKNWSKIFVAFVVVVLKFNTENQPVGAS